MSVNGVEIALGQKWVMRDGTACTVIGEKPGLLYPWIIEWDFSPAPVGVLRTRVNEHGRQDANVENARDLITLLHAFGDVHEALTFAPLDPHQGQQSLERTVGMSPAHGAPYKLSNPKDSSGDSKLPLWLLSPIAKAQWATCQFIGLLKYGAWNWRAAGVRSSVYMSALQRHVDAYISGEDLDPVDGTPHLGHIMACAGILIDAQAAGKLTDDRPPSVSLRPTYATAEEQIAAAKVRYADRAPRHYTIADTEVAQ